MSITEAIKKQAEIIKDSGARLKLAQQFEEMAKTLREATPAKEQTFREILKSANKDRNNRLSRAEHFGKVMAADKAKQAVALMRSAGWSMLGTGKEDPQKWAMKGKPGLQLHISGNSFQIFQGNEELQPKTELSLLKNYVSPVKGKSITQNSGKI